MAARLQLRIETLEARVAVLEKAVADGPRDAADDASKREPAPQIESADDELTPDFSPAQAGKLRENLSKLPAHRITIQFPAGTGAAREGAEWFKNVFKHAHWTVQGPEEAPVRLFGRSLSFFACLPVSPDVAATYFAMKKAGFDLHPAFDADLTGNEVRLIVPEQKASEQPAPAPEPPAPEQTVPRQNSVPMSANPNERLAKAFEWLPGSPFAAK